MYSSGRRENSEHATDILLKIEEYSVEVGLEALLLSKNQPGYSIALYQRYRYSTRYLVPWYTSIWSTVSMA